MVRSIGRVVPFIVPAAELAVLLHQGPPTDIDITYGELGAYAAAHEISIEGPLREYYLVDAQETPDSEKWKTEIGWPIFRSDGEP
jgi:effector-binding domain-containing protein